jgi:hypothetical protein
VRPTRASKPIGIEGRDIFRDYNSMGHRYPRGVLLRLHALMIVCLAPALAGGSPARADNLPAPEVPAAAAAQRDAPTPKDAPEHQAKTEARSSTSATNASASSAPAQTTDESRQSAVDPAEDRHLRALGYTPEMKKGVQVYCRQEAPLGSRFEQKFCTTAAQHSKSRQNSKDMLEGAQRLQVNPAGH